MTHIDMKFSWSEMVLAQSTFYTAPSFCKRLHVSAYVLYLVIDPTIRKDNFVKNLIVAVSVLLTVSVACAQTSMEQTITTRFAAADADHDGKLTRSEAQAGMPMVARHFDEIDTNHVGYVTLQQIEQFAAQHRQ